MILLSVGVAHTAVDGDTHVEHGALHADQDGAADDGVADAHLLQLRQAGYRPYVGVVEAMPSG